MAHVHVVIVGICRQGDAPTKRRIFSYSDIKGDPYESSAATLSPYLFDSSTLDKPQLVVQKTAHPLNGLPKMIIGSKPIDGGHYIFTNEEKDNFLAEEPDSEQFLHPYVGSKEFLGVSNRWILALQRAQPQILQKLPKVRERIAQVRLFRSRSKSAETQNLAATPKQYHVNIIPTDPFLLVPRVSSENRAYVPIGWLQPPVIPSDAALVVLEHATVALFGLLTSSMHMAWLRYIGGRLESRYRYSIGIVYNTFPLPPKWEQSATKLEPLAQSVLDARAANPDATLSALYDPEAMPDDLQEAHQKLDQAVDKLYRRSPFTTERERIEHLFALYEKMISPMTAKPQKRRRRKK